MRLRTNERDSIRVSPRRRTVRPSGASRSLSFPPPGALFPFLLPPSLPLSVPLPLSAVLPPYSTPLTITDFTARDSPLLLRRAVARNATIDLWESCIAGALTVFLLLDTLSVRSVICTYICGSESLTIEILCCFMNY